MNLPRVCCIKGMHCCLDRMLLKMEVRFVSSINVNAPWGDWQSSAGTGDDKAILKNFLPCRRHKGPTKDIETSRPIDGFNVGQIH